MCQRVGRLWLLGALMLVLVLVYVWGLVTAEVQCPARTRALPGSCALDGYVELSRMG